MAREITPKNFRCGLGQCPSVYEIEDGSVAIAGEQIDLENRKRFGLPDLPAHENYIKLPRRFYNELLKEGSEKTES